MSQAIQYCQTIPSPIGELQVCADNNGICAILYAPAPDYQLSPNPHTEAACHQLSQYFNGERKQFELPISPQGSEFQTQVWQQLQRIPYGQTRSYGEIAKALNKPNAVRAVGGANGKNPIPIIVPCHRVIGANGKLTGFAGGLEAKAWLLAHEQGSAGEKIGN
ncbi:MAG: methylated-DNA--[protein]-cysteine S-methyltransferase [Cellvibrionaceae bacterium]|nr:methylated-DNA--[protein]-cysteine S-methyltransferase [Cellvibrionaceae bacterium]MCV6626900.1 methylated-DNA--[protein]-cysteine S-methyltransferase [Cellvibrionaceae bacterium]